MEQELEAPTPADPIMSSGGQPMRTPDMENIPNEELEESQEEARRMRGIYSGEQESVSPAPSCLSMKSDVSMDNPINFKRELPSPDPSWGIHSGEQESVSPAPSCLSMKSDRSMDNPPNFKRELPSPVPSWIKQESSDCPSPSYPSMKGDFKRTLYPELRCCVCSYTLRNPVSIPCGHSYCEHCIYRHWAQPGSTGRYACLECEKIYRSRPKLSVNVALTTTLQILQQTGFRPAFPSLPQQRPFSTVTPENIPDKSRASYQRLVKQETFELSSQGTEPDRQLEQQSKFPVCKDVVMKTVTTTSSRIQCTSSDQPGPPGDNGCRSGIKKARKDPDLSGKTNKNTGKEFQKEMRKKCASMGSYTTLHITKEESEDSPAVHELSLNDILTPLHTVQRLVLTKGIAGIGKSYTVQKFARNWAEEKANNDIAFVFVLTFKEINLCREPTSLHRLLMDFYPTLQGLSDPLEYTKSTVAIVLDGLEESRLTFNFLNNKVVKSVTEEASLDVLLTSLIKGEMLPSARIWITSRPSAANQIPPQYVNTVTEITGFKDTQKEEYFKRKFAGNPGFAHRVISDIQSSPILLNMCNVPLFCWMLAELFQEQVGEGETKVIYDTLTVLMSHYLLLLTKQRRGKHNQKELFLCLGKLAFEHLENNSLIFTEEDLQGCNIDITIVSELCAMILKEERVIFKSKVFSFIHLTVQEFFAALYVYDYFIKKTKTKKLCSFLGDQTTLLDMLKTTINKVLERKNGHLDFFLRFLLGLTCESNHKAPSSLLMTLEGTSSENTRKKILTYLKTQRKGLSPDRCINLFQCMVEMEDNKVKDEIVEYLRLMDRSEMLSPIQCSALAYTLQVSKDELEEFDLGSYNLSELGRMRLIPVVTRSRKASLAGCNLSEECVRVLAASLMLPCSALIKLDLSNSDLLDSGVEVLTAGLSQNCRLVTLSLSGCQVTEKGCTHLASALRDKPSRLRELDLSYNHLGDGASMLSELKNNPDFILNVEHGGPLRIRPGFKKYACDLTLDPDTAHRNLLLSEDNRKVTWINEEQPYPDLPQRFQSVCQVLCREKLKERCYWEAEVSEPFNIGVTYAAGEGNKNASRLGFNEKSWSVMCSDQGCFASHGDTKVDISHKCSRSDRLGVYLDWSAGTLAFYKVSFGKATLLHRFKNVFTESLHVGVEFYPQSSVTLCQLT